EKVLKTLRSLLEVAADPTTRVDDVLALRPDRSLLRCTNSGTERVGGGAYERHFLILWEFGADGLVTRYELFDSDREEEALARFEGLTAGRGAGAPRGGGRRTRRRRPNPAPAPIPRLDAAMVAHDAEALPALLADDYEVTEQTTGDRMDRDAALA